jgi:hypothetical protein
MKNTFLLAAISASLCSCATYVTPGGPANLSQITDSDIKDSYTAKPAATYPARIAVVRVQQSGYRSNTTEGKGAGAYSVLTTPDIETEEDFERIAKLPGVAAAVRLNSLLLPNDLQTAKDIRVAAAKLQTDHVLLYTLDTKFRTNDVLTPLSVVTLGLAPTQSFSVTSTASGILMDTRTGFIYGAIEDQGADSGMATGWGVSERMDGTRIRTERQSLNKLLDSFGSLWNTIRKR